MPELPDVESFTRYFERTSLNQEIEDVVGKTKSLVKGTSFKKFKEKLVGKEFTEARRRGKFLIAEVKDVDRKIVFHFGMTGSLNYSRQRGAKFGRDEYAQVTFKFEQGYELRWINIRKLGKIYFVKKPERIDLIKEMGPEPLSLSEDEFLELLNEHERKNVKSFLMDQRDIAGIGNIYSDEILFQVEIDPHSDIGDLEEEKRKELYQKMKNVLIEASNLSHPGAKFPNSWLSAHREEMECPNYKTHKLKKEKIGGRTARFCAKCQT